jgi:hypothetical protein
MNKHALKRKRLILLTISIAVMASLLFLPACAGVKKTETSGVKTPGLSSRPSASPGSETSGSAAASEGAAPTAGPAASEPALSDYSVTWTSLDGQAQGLSVGRQEGAYPWGLSFPMTGTLKTESRTSGDAPGAVFHRVSGDGFIIWYSHIEETGRDAVSRFQTTNPEFRTPAGIGVGCTAAELFRAYDHDLLYQPEPFPVSQDFGGDFCAYDFLLVCTADCCTCVVFYMQDTAEGSIVRGLALMGPQDGCPWFDVDNDRTFAVDTALRDRLSKQDTAAETAVHDLLMVGNAGTVDKEALMAKLPDLNWTVYAGLYGKEAPDLLAWLYSQVFSDEKDIFRVLQATKGLDGAYSEGYASILAGIYDREPEKLIRQLAKLPEQKIDQVADLLAYGLSYFDMGPIKTELQELTESSSLSEREQTSARVVLYSIIDLERKS